MGSSRSRRQSTSARASTSRCSWCPTPRWRTHLRDLGAAGIRHAVVLAGGFAETGSEGRTMQERMVATARELGITLLGPNCLGFINFTTGAVCWTGAMRTPP